MDLIARLILGICILLTVIRGQTWIERISWFKFTVCRFGFLTWYVIFPVIWFSDFDLSKNSSHIVHLNCNSDSDLFWLSLRLAVVVLLVHIMAC